MMPPMAIMGAMTIRVRPMAISICTCWTSLVFRVMKRSSEAPISLCERLSTFLKNEPLTSRPMPMAVFEAWYTDVMEQAVISSATPSMMPPVRRMSSVSPWRCRS